MWHNPDSYFLNLYAIPNIFVSSLIFVVGLFVFYQNRKSSPNIFFFLFCLSLNGWLYGRALMYCSREPETALWWAKIFAKLGVVNIAPLVYAFSVHWLGLYHQQKKVVITGFSIAAILYLAILTTPYGIVGVHRYFWGYYPIYGPVGKLFLVFFFTYFLAAFRNFITEWRREKEPVRHKQIRLVTIAYMISFTGSVDFIPKVIDFPFYPWGYLSVFVWTLVLAYTIVRYRMMDIQTVIHKTVMWLTASSLFAAPAVIFIYLAKDWTAAWPPWIFMMAASMVFILFSLYTRHIQPQIDHWFQRRHWDLMQALENFTNELVYLRTLEEVAAHILKTIRTTLYVDSASLLVREGESEAFILFDSVGQRRPNLIKEQNFFLDWLEDNDVLVIEEYMSMDPRFESIAPEGRHYFEKSHAVIAVPLIINQRLIGVLNIGRKQNLRPFRSTEINFLTDLRRSAAIALSNSLHLIAMQENLRKWNEELERKVEERTQQLQQTQAQLVQAEKLATIGTLAGGIAHEINNPLTAVLTNAQILKMTAQQDDVESISLIEEGAKRCQIIIQNLLKYARKSMDHAIYREVDIHQVIRNVCSLLAYQIKQENMELVMELTEVASIDGISNELEQVITNLLINARDAIKAAKRPGKITVRTQMSGNGMVQVFVMDNGIGIEKENMRKVFDPFFTTKEIGTGTGLGLSVSYSIVQKHRGKIEIRSEKGLGTEVAVSFPALKRAVQAV